MITIENEFLKIGVLQKGAELRSLIVKNTGFEWMWQADDRIWGKSSPVLFPIVGALKENSFTFADDSYQLSRHGFARDYTFDVINHSQEKLMLRLNALHETKVCYPFDFSLIMVYELCGEKLEVSYIVYNSEDKNMYFSLGAHPAFNFPLISSSLDDITLKFPLDSTLDRYCLKNNLLSVDFDEVKLDQHELKLAHNSFDHDAWILKGVRSKEIYLWGKDKINGFCFSFEGFPYLGLWSVPGAPFICLEPWAGVPDHELHDHDFEKKEGIIMLPPLSSWSAKWSFQLINDNG